MGGTIVVDENLKPISGDHLVVVANFAIKKALTRLDVFENEIKILNKHLRELEKEMKIKKINRFINKQTS